MDLSQFFDTASTTPCSLRAKRAWQDAASDCFANPSSSHALGKRAAQRVAHARAQIARTCETTANAVIFTGSGTESDSLAIQGVALASHFKRTPGSPPVRVISSPVEHAAVRKSVASLADFGIDVQWVQVDRAGSVDLNSLTALLTPETCLVSIQCVNNVLGTIQPISEIAAILRKHAPRAIFHSDAVQAFGKLPLPAWEQGPDLISLSAHKIYGPKGIGALVARTPELLSKNRLRPLIYGGDQERGLRSGTVSPGLATAFGEASEEATDHLESHLKHTQTLAHQLHHSLGESFRWNSASPGNAQSPFVLNLDLGRIPGSLFVEMLEEKGFTTSTMSACSSQTQHTDPTLLATGCTELEAASALRISLSRHHTAADIHNLSSAIIQTQQEIARLL